MIVAIGLVLISQSCFIEASSVSLPQIIPTLNVQRCSAVCRNFVLEQAHHHIHPPQHARTRMVVPDDTLEVRDTFQGRWSPPAGIQTGLIRKDIGRSSLSRHVLIALHCIAYMSRSPFSRSMEEMSPASDRGCHRRHGKTSSCMTRDDQGSLCNSAISSGHVKWTGQSIWLEAKHARTDVV